jgi:hypothetical protein
MIFGFTHGFYHFRTFHNSSVSAFKIVHFFPSYIYWIIICSSRSSVSEEHLVGWSCLSVRTIQLNRWTDLDETWYGRYAIRVYSKIVFLNLHTRQYQHGGRTNL